MRAALFLLFLTILAHASSPRWQVDLYEPTEQSSRTGRLTFERGPRLTRWQLACTEVSDGHEARRRYRGAAPARRDWVVAEDGAAPPSRLFSLALERSAPLWLSNLEGCPSAAEPVVQRLPRAGERP